MMRNDKAPPYISDAEKQKTPLPNEVTPENAFTKLSVIAALAANQYDLKALKPAKK